MANKRHISTSFLFLIQLVLPLLVLSQPYSSIDLKKPTQYESRLLPAEKTGTGNIKGGKKVYQNTVTHYNYLFNAQNKVDEILERAKNSFVEDYSQLLPFYNYKKEDLYLQKEQLDSVIYKCTAGILLHDLRNAWVDDLYLLMGQAYLYRKDYDSAAQVFQYLNYAFAPKEDGYDLPIGSNGSNTNGQFTVVTKENSSLWNKITSTPPGRNEGFLWRIRTYIEQNQLADAFGLLAILRSDPNFPKRLLGHLNECSAYAFYQEGSYDSAAGYLVKALDRAVTHQDKARWLFLAGQLYTQTGKDSLAVHAYLQAIKSTTDPSLEVYARLAVTALESGKKANSIQENLDELLKMAKRPLYEPYRDIIYYAIAKLALKQERPDQAQTALLKSIAFNDNNPVQKQASFLLLGDLNYNRRHYPASYGFYDSLQMDLLKEFDKLRVMERKPALKTITENIAIIQREDSLQKLALMPIEQRNALLKSKLKALRKEAGLKDLDNQEPGFGGGFGGSAGQDADLFATGANEFYFQNPGLKSRGFGEFKAKWGNRPNVDNWRRQSAVEKSFAQKLAMNTNIPAPTNVSSQTATTGTELTFESLLAKLPLTTEQMSVSYLAVLKASMENAALYQLTLGDYPSAIKEYSTIVTNFPDVSETEKALFNLAGCYDSNNQPVQADSIRQLLKTNFANGKYHKLVQEQGKQVAKDNATQAYEQVYDLFLAGSFKKALEVKETADKKWGKSYWTPQLRYIEAIYYVKNGEDSMAISRLQEIASSPNTPLSEKANTMIDVLKRRKEIESYLTDLKIEKPEEMAERPIELNDISMVKKAPVPKAAINQKIAPVLVVKPQKIEPKETTVAIKMKEVEVDTTRKQPNVVLVDAPIQKSVPTISAAINQYLFNTNDPHFVAVTLDKVDGIFAGEAKNAFNRFNREQFGNQNLSIGNESILPTLQLVLIGPFANAGEAINYMNKAKPQAASRIVPWLAPEKYGFLILSGANLTILKSKKDIQEYRTFLRSVFSDIF